jgi:predicted dehydrogenase
VNEETILRELRNGPYGRCVFQCDNDVVDHQVTIFEFKGGATASFSMQAMSRSGGRKTRIFATKGDLYGDEGSITAMQFSTKEQVKWDSSMVSVDSGHGGGDYGLVRDFIQAVRFNNPNYLTSTIQASMASHLMGFKAEESRKKGTVEKMNL